jgi:hypothetical protein
MTNSAYCFDAWTIRELERDDMGHENWDEDDSINYQEDDVNDDDDGTHGIQRIQEDDDDEDDENTSSSSSSAED